MSRLQNGDRCTSSSSCRHTLKNWLHGPGVPGKLHCYHARTHPKVPLSYIPLINSAVLLSRHHSRRMSTDTLSLGQYWSLSECNCTALPFFSVGCVCGSANESALPAMGMAVDHRVEKGPH